jgi:hypothetical protein
MAYSFCRSIHHGMGEPQLLCCGITGLSQRTDVPESLKASSVYKIRLTGTFQPDPGQTRCIPCDSLPGDYYQENPGRTSCDACEESTRRYLGSSALNRSSCRCREGGCSLVRLAPAPNRGSISFGHLHDLQAFITRAALVDRFGLQISAFASPCEAFGTSVVLSVRRVKSARTEAIAWEERALRKCLKCLL